MDAHAILPVRRHRDVDHGIVEAGPFGVARADGRVVGINAAVRTSGSDKRPLQGANYAIAADRAREGAVIDFIDPVAWPAFNLADSCIVVGVFLLLWVVEGRSRRAKTT